MVARRIQQIRKDKRISQHELASVLGVTQGLISQYESAAEEPTLTILIAICDAFGCSIDYLLGRDVDYSTDTLRGMLLAAFEKMTSDNQEMFVVVLETVASINQRAV